MLASSMMHVGPSSTANHNRPPGPDQACACCFTQAPEVLFTPSLVDHEGAGMAEMVFSCIQVALLLTILARCPGCAFGSSMEVPSRTPMHAAPACSLTCHSK